MLFAALFVYSAAGAQTTQTMEEQKEMKDTVIVDGKLVEVGYKVIAEGVTDGYTKIENGVVKGYKAIENGAVTGFNSVKASTTGSSPNCSSAKEKRLKSARRVYRPMRRTQVSNMML